jgi:hypothetical protein
MRKSFFTMAVVAAAFAIVVVVGTASDVSAQVPDITIKFKAFDANQTKNPVPLVPATKANLFVRFRNEARFLTAVDVVVSTTDKGFFEMKIPRGPTVDDVWLIEQLVIEIDDPRKDFNPAIITKVVAAANMTLYPGASKSTEKFSFLSYVAQLGAYQALGAELLKEQGINSVERKGRLNYLQKNFEHQLKEMEQVSLDPNKLLTSDSKEIAVARKLIKDVLQLYELIPADAAEACDCDHDWIPFERRRILGGLRHHP